MMFRTRTSLLGSDPTERYRQRILPIEGADGSTLSLDFASETIDSRLTFTRASGEATYVDRTGRVAFASTNMPRFDYDPINLSDPSLNIFPFRGLMLEGQVVNFMKRSQAFTNAYWNDTGNNTLAVDAVAAAGSPADDTTASSLTEVFGVTVPRFVTQATGEFIPAASTSYTMSIWVKQPTSGNIGRYVQLAFWTTGFSATAYVNFDLELAITTAVGSGTTGRVTRYKNGWYRISATAISLASPASSGFQLGFVESGTAGRAAAYSVAETTEKTIYIWGPQMELGTLPTSLIVTRTSQVTRMADSLVSTGNGLANWFLNSYGSGTFLFRGTIINAANSSTTRIFALTQSASIATAVGTVPAISVGITGSVGNAAVRNRPNLNAFVAANNDVDIYLAGFTHPSEFVLAAQYSAGDYRIKRVSSATSSFASVGTTWGTNMFFSAVNGASFPVIWYKQFKFFPSRLSNEQLEVLTTL